MPDGFEGGQQQQIRFPRQRRKVVDLQSKKDITFTKIKQGKAKQKRNIKKGKAIKSKPPYDHFE
jgi:hypothetical protein